MHFMIENVKNIYEAALALTTNERAELAELLLESLDEDEANVDQAAIDASWGAEADRRYQAYKRGEIKSVPLDVETLQRRLDEIDRGTATLIPGDEAMRLFRERKKV
jgi:putative addiction module component (TIGR02574 family)